jgi:hypothetical protein
VYVMTEQQIMQMGDEEIIGFHKNLPAYKARRLDWQRFPILKQRQAIPPPPLPDLSPSDGRELETVVKQPAPPSAWRVDPALLRWGRPPPSPNGDRKQRKTA